MNLEYLELLIKKSWSKDTCYPVNQKDWSIGNPSFGQCVVTALIIQDYLGGELLFCKHRNHYWNKLPDGKEIDLTQHQFERDEKICLDEIKSKNSVLNSTNARIADTLNRYIILKQRVNSLHRHKSKGGD